MEGQYLSNGYWKITIDGKVYGVHRLLWEQANGPIPQGYVIDHIDRNPLNNDLSNLRAVPNGANRTNTNPSRKFPKGVFERFSRKFDCVMYYGDIRIGGIKETYASTKNLTEVVEWAKEVRARLLLQVYDIKEEV